METQTEQEKISHEAIKIVAETLFQQLQETLKSGEPKDIKTCIGNLKDFTKISKVLTD